MEYTRQTGHLKQNTAENQKNDMPAIVSKNNKKTGRIFIPPENTYTNQKNLRNFGKTMVHFAFHNPEVAVQSVLHHRN